MLTSLLFVALAGRSDLAVHTIGTQGVYGTAVGKGDLDILIGEKLRWSLSDGVRLWADARFLVDPATDGATFERYRVRRLGASLHLGKTTVLIGRHPVDMGGPRIVDGVQVLVDLSPVEVGFWAGLAPDLFTTAPRMRPGFGPVIGYATSSLQLSGVGDVVFAAGGLDRLGVLGSGRWSPGRVLTLDTRIDLELASAEGGPHLSDGRVGLSTRPTDAVRFGVFYNAFSSFRYLKTEDLDPELRRFDTRILENGLADGFDQDTRDPYVNHMVGADFGIRPTGDDPSPVFELSSRYRHNPDPKNRFTRVTARIGFTRIADRVELDALATVRSVNATLQTDVGAQAIVELGDGCCLIDTSALAVIDPQRFSGPGAYADLFADAILENGLAIGAGGNVTVEPLEELEAGVAGFVRLSFYQRKSRREE